MNQSKLLKKFWENDPTAWKIIYERFYYLVLYVLRKDVSNLLDAEELVNDVFIKIKGAGHDIDTFVRFRALLYKSAKNVAIDHFRKLHSQKIIKLEELDLILETVTNTERSEVNQKEAELLDLIYEEIRKLPRERKKIYLLYLEGFTIQEIAEQLQISVSTVRNQKWQTEKYLRKKLEGQPLNRNFFVLVFILQVFLQDW